jgi:hypothetical protein
MEMITRVCGDEVLTLDHVIEEIEAYGYKVLKSECF